jgi:hypothetical protein
MLDYRLYFVDPEGHIVRAPIEFDSASDEEAVAAAQQHHDGLDMELWQRRRLVAKIGKLA